MMAAIKFGSKYISPNGDMVYIIAEVGQNHQGNLNVAKKIITEAKRIGCDCVKFQKSCLSSKFTKSALNRPYTSENSWGSTYGEHKKYLEFSEDQYRDLQMHAKEIGIDFTASAMDEISLDFLQAIKVPFIKIGSGDANNVLLLSRAAGVDIPLIVSTGMQTTETIDKIVQIMQKNDKTNYALMHCVSSYPTEPKESSLRMIPLLKEQYPSVVIGYSGHEKGIEISKAAVLLGARIIERHFTLDKNQKGSDHKCSLEPAEFESLVKFIKKFEKLGPLNNDQVLNILHKNKDVELALTQVQSRTILLSELPCKMKLGKSIVAVKYLKAGDTLKLRDLCIKVSEPMGISAEHFDSILGKVLATDVDGDSPIMFQHLLV
ncbi:sialic acid synthase [Anastrepha ludens]|uniref:sialic acid synthase n=1 Tax=Anastrepha ludens TaxID=28586 RepID=UPI0023B10C4E|nr:sialic acid synthase [Anastrepha ludens]